MTVNLRLLFMASVGALVLGTAACSSAPKKETETTKQNLMNDRQPAYSSMSLIELLQQVKISEAQYKDPSLKQAAIKYGELSGLGQSLMNLMKNPNMSVSQKDHLNAVYIELINQMTQLKMDARVHSPSLLSVGPRQFAEAIAMVNADCLQKNLLSFNSENELSFAGADLLKTYSDTVRFGDDIGNPHLLVAPQDGKVQLNFYFERGGGGQIQFSSHFEHASAELAMNHSLLDSNGPWTTKFWVCKKPKY